MLCRSANSIEVCLVCQLDSVKALVLPHWLYADGNLASQNQLKQSNVQTLSHAYMYYKSENIVSKEETAQVKIAHI